MKLEQLSLVQHALLLVAPQVHRLAIELMLPHVRPARHIWQHLRGCRECVWFRAYARDDPSVPACQHNHSDVRAGRQTEQDSRPTRHTIRLTGVLPSTKIWAPSPARTSSPFSKIRQTVLFMRGTSSTSCRLVVIITSSPPYVSILDTTWHPTSKVRHAQTSPERRSLATDGNSPQALTAILVRLDPHSYWVR